MELREASSEPDVDGTITARGNRASCFPPLTALCIGLILSGFLAWWTHQKSHIEAQLQFERRAERLADEIQRRIKLTGHGLMGARDLFVGSEQVTRLEFRTFVESRNFDVEFPGAIGFGLVQRVLRGDLAAFEATERLDAAPDYTVHTTGSAPDLYPIRFIEPRERNKEALGYDVGAESLRRAAVEKAIATGEHTLTRPIDLVQDAVPRAGFLYFVPLYKKHSNPKTPAERLAVLDGVLFAPIIIDNLFIGIADVTEDMLNLDIFDGESTEQNDQLFDFEKQNFATTGLKPVVLTYRSTFETLQYRNIADRVWTIRIRPTPAFQSTIDTTTPLIAGGSGALLSLMLAFVFWTVGQSRAQANELATTQKIAQAREQDHIKHRRELELRLRERTLALEEAQVELLKQERMAVLGKLIATVSHELRNPLGTIRASLYMVMKRTKSADLNVERPLARAERNILRCDRIIEELLDYTRNRPHKREMTDFQPWLQETREDFAFPAIIQVKQDFSATARLEIDQVNFRRCIINIWQNACDSMLNADGSYFADGEATLSLSSRIIDDRLEVVSRDNGTGIDEDVRTKMFEPLFTTKDFGVGLGLSIVSEILTAHGGGIEFANNPEGGTTVVLWLPLNTPESPSTHDEADQ